MITLLLQPKISKPIQIPNNRSSERYIDEEIGREKSDYYFEDWRIYKTKDTSLSPWQLWYEKK